MKINYDKFTQYAEIVATNQQGEIMDPDKALEEMREIHASGSREDFERLLELFMGIDTWLQGGGFLPQDWRAANRDLSDTSQYRR